MLKKWMAAAVLVAISASAQAQVVADAAWSRMTAATAPTGVVFMQLHNTGKEADALVSATTPVAKKVELHNHIHDNGVMRMRQVAQIEVAAEGHVTLQPGGLHVMLMGLKQPLKLQQTFPLVLKYASGRSQTVTVTVNNGEGMVSTHQKNGAHSQNEHHNHH
ncbi:MULTISPECIES: copper chaperone PCu(A)C [Vitreoscilla]|uniref:Copper chaperone PCu(A)C n=1 Tax=Vitreoscilla stercoraria TaxID=61 RepID=A0ABY4EAE4_VITST|nr:MULTISPECIES: copper chaperone PCu(A)C [Vitreoscilla]AUZ04813.1 hypothetical protein ADP71_11600 [Vitreoscilla sp. C1]UOO91518.1 copper chaperone PCu(A)C [Vitreoscilla stercoraria]